MAARRRRLCLSHFVKHVSALVFLLCIAAAEDCQPQPSTVIHRKVGEDVELSCFQGGIVSSVKWMHNGSLLVDYSPQEVYYGDQFKDRLYLNPTNFSVTLKNLKLTDSGEFKFFSIILENERPRQTPTVFLTLQVHEVLTAPPVLNFTSTQSAPNASCTVFLVCSSNAAGGVTYTWTVGNRTTAGTNLTYVIGPEDGDTVFTCTVANILSKVSTSVSVSGVSACSSEAGGPYWIWVGVGISAFLVIVSGAVLAICRTRCQEAPHSDQTVYADIPNIIPRPERRDTLQGTLPNSLYDSIDIQGDPVSRVGPQTLYDTVQFKHMRANENSNGIV